MIRDAGSIDSEETILTVYAAIRSATKEEDARICNGKRIEESTIGEIADANFNLALGLAEEAILASK